MTKVRRTFVHIEIIRNFSGQHADNMHLTLRTAQAAALSRSSMRSLVSIKKWDSQPSLKYVATYRQGGKRQVRYFKDQKGVKTFAQEKTIEL